MSENDDGREREKEKEGKNLLLLHVETTTQAPSEKPEQEKNNNEIKIIRIIQKKDQMSEHTELLCIESFSFFLPVEEASDMVVIDTREFDKTLLNENHEWMNKTTNEKIVPKNKKEK